jgi:hypothetical protein
MNVREMRNVAVLCGCNLVHLMFHSSFVALPMDYRPVQEQQLDPVLHSQEGDFFGLLIREIQGKLFALEKVLPFMFEIFPGQHQLI